MSNGSKTTQRTKGAGQASASPALPSAAVSYIAGVIGAAAILVALAVLQYPPTGGRLILLWAAAALCGELMIFSTTSGRAHINLATAIHICMILVLDPGQIAVAILLSRGVAKFILKRQVWYRALFNVAQVSAAILVASMAYGTLGGGLGVEFTRNGLLGIAPAFAAAALLYYVLNTGTVSGVVAITTGDVLWRTWRENYGYVAEIAGTFALIFLAPVIALCYQTLGAAGLLVFLLPMAFVRLSSVRYIALRQAQQDLIANERLAAKGEIAAEVGHEINNYLTAVYGHIQLMAMQNDGPGDGEVKRRLGLVVDQLSNIRALSKGLVDFSNRETRMNPTPLAGLVRGTVAFLQPQNRFDRVDIQADIDPRVGEVVVDSAQIQQALMNLLLNAANAMAEHETVRPRIDVWVRLHDITGKVEIAVADSGPGVPTKLRERVFEPGFTTRTQGHGFGLSTTHSIISAHDGVISVEDSPHGGALFRILLPVAMKKAA